MLYGKECKDTRYDLITVIVINIGDNYNGEETDNPMLNSLNVLFNSDFNADIKIRRLKEYNVPVIDLNEYSNKLLKENGYTGTKAMNIFVADELHFTETGANWIADFVASELVRLGLPVGDCVLAK